MIIEILLIVIMDKENNKVSGLHIRKQGSENLRMKRTIRIEKEIENIFSTMKIEQ
jgi:hypothetical protein